MTFYEEAGDSCGVLCDVFIMVLCSIWFFGMMGVAPSKQTAQGLSQTFLGLQADK